MLMQKENSFSTFLCEYINMSFLSLTGQVTILSYQNLHIMFQ